MPEPQSALYIGDRSGAKVYRIGRVGFDSGRQDLGSNSFDAFIETERFSPAGEGGLVHFRRIAVRALTNSDYKYDVKVWVDDERTTLGDGTTQTVTIDESASGMSEVIDEVEIDAVGTHIRVRIDITSTDIPGLFLPEQIDVQHRPQRQAAQREGDAT